MISGYEVDEGLARTGNGMHEAGNTGTYKSTDARPGLSSAGFAGQQGIMARAAEANE